ncbi:MAG TPA: dienelactone hydrolase family protein [Bryobacteraceae bacterium]|nr:dienelactone hydrolase family protein [Bryobacteraceae bacterium]
MSRCSSLASSSPGAGLENRRDFLVKGLALGFALAARPIGAPAAVTTDAAGLSAGEVKIPVPGGALPGYRACPIKGRLFPTVLVVPDIFGVDQHIKDLCRRLAHSGYCAVAAEIFARQGDVSKISDVQEIVSQVVSRVPDSQVMSDLDAAIAWAGKSSRGDTSRVAIAGFCWGGRIVWLYAANSGVVKAGAAWCGRLEGDRTQVTPRHPIDCAGSFRAPVIGFYAGKDPSIPLESVEKMRSVLSVVGDPSQIVVYPEAQRGFDADDRPSYEEAAARDAWRKMLDWFKKYGV